jgi:hypothetical protein
MKNEVAALGETQKVKGGQGEEFLLPAITVALNTGPEKTKFDTQGHHTAAPTTHTMGNTVDIRIRWQQNLTQSAVKSVLSNVLSSDPPTTCPFSDSSW